MIAPQVEIAVDTDLVVVRLSQDIDLANAGRISAQVLDAIPNDALGLVVDLSAVRYIDSAGIQILFTLVRRLKACRQTMTISVQDDSAIHTLLKITGLDGLVKSYPSAEQCVAALRSGVARTY